MGMDVTDQQLAELVRLSGGTQPTFRRSRARVQNNLRSKGLARLFNQDGHVPGDLEFLISSNYRPLYDTCEITDSGRAVLRDVEKSDRERYLAAVAEVTRCGRR